MSPNKLTTAEHLLSMSLEAQSDLLQFVRDSTRPQREGQGSDEDYILKIIALHKYPKRRQAG